MEVKFVIKGKIAATLQALYAWLIHMGGIEPRPAINHVYNAF
jgi:hypothetical protein